MTDDAAIAAIANLGIRIAEVGRIAGLTGNRVLNEDERRSRVEKEYEAAYEAMEQRRRQREAEFYRGLGTPWQPSQEDRR